MSAKFWWDCDNCGEEYELESPMVLDLRCRQCALKEQARRLGWAWLPIGNHGWTCPACVAKMLPSRE